jgi:3-methyl-2-oxobutanoate hydroxymethyltransferase
MSITIQHLHKLKAKQQKIVALTAYDATFARLFSEHGVEVLLVGDSLGQLIQGHTHTLPVTLEQMIYHTECAARGNQGAFLIADMPFMTYATTQQTLDSAAQLMRAGAQMVKLEGGCHLKESISKLVEQGIPVCGHLGLTPQSVHALGGYRVQGKTTDSGDKIFRAAEALVDAGIQLLVLECIPSDLAADIAGTLAIPVIGIGAGAATDGQILVSYDLLGMHPSPPKFVKNFMQGSESIEQAVQRYVAAVKSTEFPTTDHSYDR